MGFIAQRAKKMILQKEINDLKKQFLEFEEVMDCFKQEQNIQDVNPLVHLGYLILGCLGYLGSFLIIFHVYAIWSKVPGYFTISAEMANLYHICSIMLSNGLQWPLLSSFLLVYG